MLLATLLLALVPADDISFADALAERGYLDLAREIYQRCLDDPSPAVRRAARYGLADRTSPEAIAAILEEWPQDEPRRGGVEYDYAAALFEKGRYAEMRTFLLGRFLWEYDLTRLALAARILLGRAAAAERKWEEAFSQFRLARQPGAPLISAQSVYFELRARLEARQPKPAIGLTRAFFRAHPRIAGTDIGIAILLENALALHAAGRRKEAERELSRIEARHKGGWAGDVAMEYLDRIVGNTRPAHVLSRADWFFEHGHHTQAAVKYRTALSAGVDTARIWFRLGTCYRRLGRFHEAALALRETRRFPDTEERIEGALLREKVLAHLGDAAPVEEQRTWNRDNIPPEVLGPRRTLDQGRSHMDAKDWKAAAECFERLPDSPEAVHYLAYCRVKMNHGKALETFERHLKMEDSSPRRVTWSYYFITRRAAPGRAVEAAADFRRTVPGADPLLSIWIDAHEVRAHLRMKSLEDAEQAFDRLRGAVERERMGISPLLHAARPLARAFHEAKDLRRAAKFYAVVIEYDPDAVRPELILSLAELLHAGGEFAKAMDLLMEIDSGEFHVERLRVECLIGTGQVDQAVQRADGLADPENGSVRELRGDARHAKAMSLPRGQERFRWLREALEIYGLAFELKRVPEHYYRVLHKYAVTLYELDLPALDRLFERLDLEGEKDWGGAAMAEKFRKLRADLHRRMPDRKE